MRTENEIMMQAIQTVQSNQIELAARIDGLEVMAASIGSHVGIDAVEFTAKLRTMQASCHQERLQLVEDRNPAAAASMDQRIGIPEIDEETLGGLDIRPGTLNIKPGTLDIRPDPLDPIG